MLQTLFQKYKNKVTSKSKKYKYENKNFIDINFNMFFLFTLYKN